MWHDAGTGTLEWCVGCISPTHNRTHLSTLSPTHTHTLAFVQAATHARYRLRGEDEDEGEDGECSHAHRRWEEDGADGNEDDEDDDDSDDEDDDSEDESGDEDDEDYSLLLAALNGHRKVVVTFRMFS